MKKRSDLLGGWLMALVAGCSAGAPGEVAPGEVAGTSQSTSQNGGVDLPKPGTEASLPSCAQAAANHQGYGGVFVVDGVSYRKANEDWAHNGAREFWCVVSPSGPVAEPTLFEHRGKKLFLTGVNIGNIQFLPFSQSTYTHSAAELKEILRKAFADLKASGTNSVRFWLHIDGSQSPTWATGESGASAGKPYVSGLPAGLVDDLKWLIRAAYVENGLLVNLTLWSHDILAVRRLNPVANRERAITMMTEDWATQKYIDNALVPMLEALKAKMDDRGQTYQDGIMSWEVLNEPEGLSAYWRLYWNYQYAMKYGEYNWRRTAMSYLDARSRTEYALDSGEDSWAPVKYKGWHFVGTIDPSFNFYLYKDVTDDYPSEWDYLKKAIVDDKVLATREVPYQNVMRFINKVAGAIHRVVPEAKVSSGAHSMPYNTDVAMPGLGYENAPFNYYSDEALIRSGGDPLGTLDFYQVHGYPEWNDHDKDQLLNMFRHPASYWRQGKPLIVGEHWSIIGAGNEYLKPHHYAFLHDNGYAGVWGWAYFYVRESYNATTRQWQRRIDKHENQDFYRELFQGLPSRLKYPID